MWTFARQIAAERPAFFAVHGIDAGDALALATRFDCGWAYRGRQALFWEKLYHAQGVHDRYLPAAPLWPFDRRGLLEVRGNRDGEPWTLVASQLASDRTHVRELRFLRSALRRIEGHVLLFVAGHDEAARVGFADLGFLRLRGMDGCAIFARA